MLNDPRAVLERLCAERGEDFAGLSRMLGRNPAYIQQFVRRGVPKKLGESERRKLARYFSIAESLLGGPADDQPIGGLVPVKRTPVRASAGRSTSESGMSARNRDARAGLVMPLWKRLSAWVR